MPEAGSHCPRHGCTKMLSVSAPMCGGCLTELFSENEVRTLINKDSTAEYARLQERLEWWSDGPVGEQTTLDTH